ncbi:MAG: c-type cytochrome [Hyphomicrobiaceae bacterium]
MRSLCAVVVLACAVVAVGPERVRAQADVVARGLVVAEGHCSRCHAVGATGESPQRLVIPFRNLYVRFPVDMLVEALQSGTVGGHDEMPMFELGRRDTHALIAYIDSLSPPEARYLAPPAKP